MKRFRLLVGVMSCLLFVGCGGVPIPDIPDKIIIERAIRIDDSSGGFQKKITITDRKTILQIVDELRSASPVYLNIPKSPVCGYITLDYGDQSASIEIDYFSDRLIRVNDGEYYYVSKGGWLDNEMRKVMRYRKRDIEDD